MSISLLSRSAKSIMQNEQNKKLVSYNFTREARSALTELARENKRSRTAQVEWLILEEKRRVEHRKRLEENNSIHAE